MQIVRRVGRRGRGECSARKRESCKGVMSSVDLVRNGGGGLPPSPVDADCSMGVS